MYQENNFTQFLSDLVGIWFACCYILKYESYFIILALKC